MPFFGSSAREGLLGAYRTHLIVLTTEMLRRDPSTSDKRRLGDIFFSKIQLLNGSSDEFAVRADSTLLAFVPQGLVIEAELCPVQHIPK